MTEDEDDSPNYSYQEVARRMRRKRAWELRYLKHLKWRDVGAVLGVGAERARRLAAEHERVRKESE